MSQDTEKNESLESGGETINYTSKKVEPVDQQFAELNEKNKQFILYSLDDVNDLFVAAKIDATSLKYTAKDLDELIYQWNNQQRLFSQVSEEQFARAVGAAFGEYLNKTVSAKWMILTDEYGTDYCCMSTESEKYDSFQLFPFSSVWKAIEDKREKSLNGIVVVVQKNIGK